MGDQNPLNSGKKTKSKDKIFSNYRRYALEKAKKDVSKNTKIEELRLSVRAYNCLKNSNINTVMDLISRSEIDLRLIRGMGSKSINEIKEILQSSGYKLSDKVLHQPKKEPLRSKILNGKMNYLLALAEQQLLGYCHAKKGFSLKMLIDSMGLTKTEWKLLKKWYTLDYLKEDDFEEIENYFKTN